MNLNDEQERRQEVNRILHQLTCEQDIHIAIPKGLVEMLDRRYPINNGVPVLHLWSAINEAIINQLIKWECIGPVFETVEP